MLPHVELPMVFAAYKIRKDDYYKYQLYQRRNRDMYNKRKENPKFWTLKRVGKLYGISRERVRQILCKVERKDKKHKLWLANRNKFQEVFSKIPKRGVK